MTPRGSGGRPVSPADAAAYLATASSWLEAAAVDRPGIQAGQVVPLHSVETTGGETEVVKLQQFVSPVVGS
jgi:hypothetical protein